MSESPREQSDIMWPLTAGLLLLITLATATLWMRERTGRAADRDALRQQIDVQEKQLMLQAMLQPQEPGAAVSRDDLPMRYAELDGTQVPVRTLSAQAGERIGLMPGDVIVVAEELAPEGDSGSVADGP
jgi:hypothetical protein